MTASPDIDARLAFLPRGIRPLGFRNYGLFWIGYLVSNAGRWMELTGAVWLLSQMTDLPLALALLGLVRAIPGILLSPVAGVVSDRVDQRRLLFATQMLSLFASLILGVLVLNGTVQIWNIYLQVAIQSALQAFDASTRQALFPRLVPRDYLPEAVTLHSVAGRLSQLIGPALGGLAIAAYGDAAPFLINSATFLILMGAILGIHGVVPRRAREGSSMRGELVEGLRYILDTPILAGLLRLEVVFGLFQINAVMITIIARDILQVGPEGLGGLLSAGALGAIVGVTYLLIVGPARRLGRAIVWCQLIYAGLMVSLAVGTEYWPVFIALAALGFFDSLATVTRHNVMQLAAPGRMRGRVMANMGTVTRGTTPLSQTISGILAALLGPALAVGVSAVALGVSATTAGRMNRDLWSARKEDLVRTTPTAPLDPPAELMDPPGGTPL